METVTTSESSWGGDLNLTQPHFDDERTILAAKPVVPLQIVAKVRHRQRWILGGAFVIASLLGSVVALALVRVQRSTVVDRLSTETTVQRAEPIAQKPVDEVVGEAEPLEEEFSEEIEAATDADSPQPSAKRKRRVNRRSSSTVTVTVEPKPESDDSQPRLIDSWVERRQRRVDRQTDNHHRSDLFRIREIFEGPRRPRPDQPE